MTTTTTSQPAEAGVSRGVASVGDGDEPAMRDSAAELVERARREGVELTGDNGLLAALVRQVLQTEPGPHRRSVSADALRSPPLMPLGEPTSGSGEQIGTSAQGVQQRYGPSAASA